MYNEKRATEKGAAVEILDSILFYFIQFYSVIKTVTQDAAGGEGSCCRARQRPLWAAAHRGSVSTGQRSNQRCPAAISPVERCRLQKSGNEELKLRLEEAVGRQVGGKGGMNGGMVETQTAGGVFSFEPPPPL